MHLIDGKRGDYVQFNLRWCALHSVGERAMSKRSVWIAGGPVRGEKEAHFWETPQKYTSSKKAPQKYTGSKGKRETAVQVHWKGKASSSVKCSLSESERKRTYYSVGALCWQRAFIFWWFSCSNVLSLQLSGPSSKLSWEGRLSYNLAATTPPRNRAMCNRTICAVCNYPFLQLCIVHCAMHTDPS